MAFAFPRLLAAIAACAIATLAASCCCPTRRSCPVESTECWPCGTTFQRLVVTNKHTKSVLVSATAWNDSGTNPVEVPLKNTPALVVAGGTQAFPIQAPGTNVDRIVVSYLADDDSDNVAAVENFPVGANTTMITRCVRSYQPDTYVIVESCP